MNDWFGFNYNETVYALYAVLLLAVCLINVFDVRITAMLNNGLGVLAHGRRRVIVLVLIFVPSHHKSVSYVFTDTVNFYGLRGNEASTIRCSGSCSASGCSCPSTPSPATTLRRTWRGDAQRVAIGRRSAW